MMRARKKDAWGSRFSFSELERFLRFCKRVAPVIPLRDFKKGKDRCIILKQDADLDLYPSFEFARIQKSLGVRSTFFVLTTSHTYNPQSAPLRRMLKEMSDDGFEIGLHFDPSVYGRASKAELERAVRDECAVLERITGCPIRSIALHNPSITGEYPIFKGYLNTHDKAFFSNERYISDSMRVDPMLHPYRGKDPYAFGRNSKKFPLLITLHPEQFLPCGGDYADTIARYQSRMAVEIMRAYLDLLDTIRREKLYSIK